MGKRERVCGGNNGRSGRGCLFALMQRRCFFIQHMHNLMPMLSAVYSTLVIKAPFINIYFVLDRGETNKKYKGLLSQAPLLAAASSQ